MANNHKHSPWRKSVLIPFWTLQLFFMLVMIALLALSIGVLVSVNTDNYDFGEYDGDVYHVVNVATRIVGPVWISMCAICLILTITEIILLARHKLKPLAFLIMNVIKSFIWTVLFVLDIVSTATSGGRTASVIAIIIELILVLSFWIPLIYGSVIYHRFRKEKKTYKPVDPLSNPVDTSYPSQYPTQSKGYATPEPHSDLESNMGSIPSNGRRASYNHERDTRFEAYRQQDRGTYSDIGMQDSVVTSPDVPQVYVQHHDVNVYEMEHTRRDLR